MMNRVVKNSYLLIALLIIVSCSAIQQKRGYAKVTEKGGTLYYTDLFPEELVAPYRREYIKLYKSGRLHMLNTHMPIDSVFTHIDKVYDRGTTYKLVNKHLSFEFKYEYEAGTNNGLETRLDQFFVHSKDVVSDTMELEFQYKWVRAPKSQPMGTYRLTFYKYVR